MEESIKKMFPAEMWPAFERVFEEIPGINEVRLRVGAPAYVAAGGKEYFLCKEGTYSRVATDGNVITKGQMLRMLEHLTKYSPYAYDAELRQGFITMPGGHRVGIVGQGIVEESGRVKGLKYISGMNIRIARQIEGIATQLLPYLYTKGRVENVLLASPPGCGKTTYLRDFVRQISEGNAFGQGMSVGLVDERMEISAMHMGEPCMYLGKRCDVISGVSKREAIFMLLRSMNPGVIAVDEIGNEADAQALNAAASCGIGLLATIHAGDIEDLLWKDKMSDILKDGIFTRIIFLKTATKGYGVKSVWKRKPEGGYACVKEWD